MPGGDGTGPAGMGPMTGRAAGYCAGYGVPGYMNPVGGRGLGFGRGLGLGFRGGRGWGGFRGAPYAASAYGVPAAPYAAPYGAAPTREQQAEALKSQAAYFEEALEDVKKRLADLETREQEKQ